MVPHTDDGRVLFAAGEERFSRVKQHAGFPGRSIAAALEATGTSPAEIDVVAYPFLTWDQEARLIEKAFAEEAQPAAAGFQKRPDLPIRGRRETQDLYVLAMSAGS